MREGRANAAGYTASGTPSLSRPNSTVLPIAWHRSSGVGFARFLGVRYQQGSTH
jgi:hypothetical protein